MKDLCDVHCNSSLRAMTPVLRKWHDIVIQYSRENPEDSCWTYNERATLSTFAGAAWRAHWLAIEEFATRKHKNVRDANTGEKIHGTGRCDLYLANRSTSYAFEAKQAWQPIGDRIAKPYAEALGRAEGAFADAQALRHIEADRRVAITFVAPSFPTSRLPKNAERRARHQISTDMINHWINDFPWRTRFDGVAWVFPRDSRCRTNEAGDRVFPGVLAVLQECHRSRRIKTSGSARAPASIGNRRGL